MAKSGNNAVAGAFPVDGGQIIIDGTDVTKLPEHKRAKYIGRVFQDPMMGTAGDMWVEENLAIADRRGKSRGLKWAITKKDREKYRAALTELGLGLENRLTTKMKLLSGGQRQAVTLLMAAMEKPKLLLLNRPHCCRESSDDSYGNAQHEGRDCSRQPSYHAEFRQGHP